MKPLACAALLCALTLPAHAGKTFTLASPQLGEGVPLSSAQVFQGMGCEGGNRSPALRWDNPPAGTRSFALTVYDPDAPTGSGWWHWLVVNLPANARALPEGASPKAGLPAGTLEIATDFGQPGYGGACPPPGHGMHRYQFTVWALDTDRLPLKADSQAALAGFLLNQHALGKATITATYAR
ncbi:YbhB/YbcL family Raf kinase inhibitor-like protein [Crenobacter caeni]|uniref:YbhB/YbcL family Raf kinase inhibitor-like protein n=1 Tax=Crenobacter caeni TaxID=2705474 RepID=A0A6B2KVX7_9NEIS|nr:YbhB/YbcL family Raf kinase inhibitor-like protein [Crenobacter caeni]NDV14159.1 YbhB/YbcL family Raf kinase inhibitor-like protein [Crenobacter caeni]